jgi:hypothetical protein
MPELQGLKMEIILPKLSEHEMIREFHDYFVANPERNWFSNRFSEMFPKHFRMQCETVIADGRVTSNQFSEGPQGYKAVKYKPDQIIQIWIDTLDEHNPVAINEMNPTLFHEAGEHLSSIVRVVGMWNEITCMTCASCGQC